MFFVAAVIGLAVVKEALHGLGQNRVAVQARGTTRADRMFALGAAARLLERLGARILGVPLSR
jgi:predicted small integral membrane protein